MSLLNLLLFAVFFCQLPKVLHGLDVSFIPNDENAPLPLSAKYRTSLRRLCNLMEKYPPSNRNTKSQASGSTSNNILADLYGDSVKHRALQNLCIKLAADDKNIEQASSDLSFSSVWQRLKGSWMLSTANTTTLLILGLSGIGMGIAMREKDRIRRWSNNIKQNLFRLSGGRRSDYPLNSVCSGTSNDHGDDDDDKQQPSLATLRAARLRHFAASSVTSTST